MMKSVYIETSVLSYLAARPSRDPKAAILQSITMEWWEKERHAFQLFTSALVLAEVRFGDPNASRRRIELLQDLTFLDIVEDAETLADTRWLAKALFPGKQDPTHCTFQLQVCTNWITCLPGTVVTSTTQRQNRRYGPYRLRRVMRAPKYAPRLNFCRRKMMYKDEIISEVWRARDALMQTHHNDIKELVAYLQELQQKESLKVVDRRKQTKQQTAQIPAKQPELSRKIATDDEDIPTDQ